MTGRRFLLCRLLAGLGVAAAMRANEVVIMRRNLATPFAATNEHAPHTLLPPSQRGRLAAAVAGDAGELLPHPFSPHLCLAAIGGYACCCRLASSPAFAADAPACGFAGWPGQKRPESREVPLAYASDGTPV